jgi:hypothetical protein
MVCPWVWGEGGRADCISVKRSAGSPIRIRVKLCLWFARCPTRPYPGAAFSFRKPDLKELALEYLSGDNATGLALPWMLVPYAHNRQLTWLGNETDLSTAQVCLGIEHTATSSPPPLLASFTFRERWRRPGGGGAGEGGGGGGDGTGVGTGGSAKRTLAAWGLLGV